MGERIICARAGPSIRTTVPQPGGRSSSRDAITTRSRPRSGSTRRGAAARVRRRIVSRCDDGVPCGSRISHSQSVDRAPISVAIPRSVGGRPKHSCTRTERVRAAASGAGPTMPSPWVRSTTMGAPVTVAAHSRSSRCSFVALTPPSRIPLGAVPAPSATRAVSVCRQRATAARPSTIFRADGVFCQASSRHRE